jgi:hypothetical protein
LVIELPSEHLGPEKSVHGVIGFNVLSRMEVLLDIPGREVVFSERGTTLPLRRHQGEPPEVLDFRLRQGFLIELCAKIGEAAEVRTILDTGSRITVLNPRAAAAARIDFTVVDGEVSSATAPGARPPRFRGVAEILRIGAMEWHRPEVHLVDLPIFSGMGLGRVPAAILGTDLLRQFAISLHYSSRTLRIWRR